MAGKKKSSTVKAVNKARAKARKMVGNPFKDISNYDKSLKKKKKTK